MNLRRNRYQHGSLTTERRSNGPDVWVYRWREPSSNGKTVKRKRIIGTIWEYASKTAAQKAVDALKLDINAEVVSTVSMTIRELAKHYEAVELGDGCGKTLMTRETYLHHLRDDISPRWGAERIGDIKPFRVEGWLKSLDKADATKAKIKNVFGVLFQHALRYGWAVRNPIREVRQSAKRRQEPDVLTLEEVLTLLALLPAHARTMVVVAAVTGLRRGELVGLKWEDVDFENGMIHIRRSLVDQVEGLPKTEASKRPIPLESGLAQALLSWRQLASFTRATDWVFASPFDSGQMPYWAGTVMQKVVQPAAKKAGIQKRIGWHTFRRTTATWLLANGASVKTTQDLLRHANPTITLGTYAQSIDEHKRGAQGQITAMLGLEGGNGELATTA
ncbi:MAG TPA: site-specific integrase [Acidobacteriaceae bacterium]|jgi:integrase